MSYWDHFCGDTVDKYFDTLHDYDDFNQASCDKFEWEAIEKRFNEMWENTKKLDSVKHYCKDKLIEDLTEWEASRGCCGNEVAGRIEILKEILIIIREKKEEDETKN
jgi:hypothetical protein